MRAHQRFRAFFVVNESSLVQGGKDVSRALRNRCQEIRFFFNQTENISKSIENLDSEYALLPTLVSEAMQEDLCSKMAIKDPSVDFATMHASVANSLSKLQA